MLNNWQNTQVSNSLIIGGPNSKYVFVSYKYKKTHFNKGPYLEFVGARLLCLVWPFVNCRYIVYRNLYDNISDPLIIMAYYGGLFCQQGWEGKLTNDFHWQGVFPGQEGNSGCSRLSSLKLTQIKSQWKKVNLNLIP